MVNLKSLTSLEVQWQGVIRMRERMDHLVTKTFAFDPVVSPVFGNILYNLPLLLAFEVLRQVLLQAQEDGQFTAPGPQLDKLMDGARTTLPWIDWHCLRETVERREDVAQDGRLLGDKQCLQDIASIEAQLLAWGVIKVP